MNAYLYYLFLHAIIFAVGVFSVLAPVAICIFLAKVGWWPTVFFMIAFSPKITLVSSIMWGIALHTSVALSASVAGLGHKVASSLGLVTVMTLLPACVIFSISYKWWKSFPDQTRKDALDYRNRIRARSGETQIAMEDVLTTGKRAFIWPEYIFDLYRVTHAQKYVPPGFANDHLEGGSELPKADKINE